MSDADDRKAMLRLIDMQDVGFKYHGARTQRHVWVDEHTKRRLTVRERKALDSLLVDKVVRPQHAIGAWGRGYYERTIYSALTPGSAGDTTGGGA